MSNPDQSISLKLLADARFIPLIQGVVEQSGTVFGLERNKALRMTMASEELVSHLAATAGGAEIDLTVTAGGWCVTADFSFIADPSDLWAMNLVAKENIGAGKSMDHLGLLLASRMSDGFSIRLDGKVVHLELRQDLDYPFIEPQPGSRGVAKGAVRIVDNPESALIKEACAQVLNLYPAHEVHEAFYKPGKVVDMAARKDLDVVVAVDEIGALAGMISWRSPSERSVSFSGPYIFLDGGDTAEVLETHLLNTVARTDVVSLFSDLGTDDLISQNFEELGKLDFVQPDDDTIELDVWFRHLREDSGAAVWAHPAMHGFLESVYDRLVLMRTIRDTDGSGEKLPDRSVFSVRLRPELKEATLSPLVAGADASEVVAHHLETLSKDGYRNIFFDLDLAYGWQAAMGKALMDNGFEPKLVLPYAGKSDVVVFRHG